jgi:hypothetical protein
MITSLSSALDTILIHIIRTWRCSKLDRKKRENKQKSRFVAVAGHLMQAVASWPLPPVAHTFIFCERFAEHPLKTAIPAPSRTWVSEWNPNQMLQPWTKNEPYIKGNWSAEQRSRETNQVREKDWLFFITFSWDVFFKNMRCVNIVQCTEGTFFYWHENDM